VSLREARIVTSALRTQLRELCATEDGTLLHASRIDNARCAFRRSFRRLNTLEVEALLLSR
jgi:hypothetical protein